jgi:hypothetical protein
MASCRKSRLIAVAQGIYHIAGDQLASDVGVSEQPVVTAMERYVAKIRELAFSRSDEVPLAAVETAGLFNILLQTHDGHAQIIGHARWAASGFPFVAVGHKYAAALLVTNTTLEAVAAARPPFPAFVIEVPEGLLFTHDAQGTANPIRFILVHQLANPRLPEGWAWAYTTYADNDVSMFRYGVTAEELLPEDIPIDTILEGGREGNDDRTPLSLTLTDEDKRTSALVGRLIVNVCLAFSDPANVAERGNGRKSARKKTVGKSRGSDEPVVRNYFLGQSIEHDFRDVVARYIRGERRSPSVQVLASGYYRMQPHGPRNSLRRLQWIKPSWRGPETAPIPIRSVVVNERCAS